MVIKPASSPVSYGARGEEGGLGRQVLRHVLVGGGLLHQRGPQGPRRPAPGVTHQPPPPPPRRPVAAAAAIRGPGDDSDALRLPLRRELKPDGCVSRAEGGGGGGGLACPDPDSDPPPPPRRDGERMRSPGVSGPSGPRPRCAGHCDPSRLRSARLDATLAVGFAHRSTHKSTHD